MALQRETGTLRVAGRVDAVVAPELREAVITMVTDNAGTAVTVDLAEVGFIDSAGLACLVQGMKRARQAGGDLCLTAPENGDAFRVFELTRFDRVFEFVPSPAAAPKAA